MPNETYVGRFAPSPNGPLHFGSLLTAVGSYLDARSQRGRWLVRIENLDPPREVPGAADDILRTLERFGLKWDEQVVYQDQRHADYVNALQQLDQLQLTYPCACSRKDIQENALGTKTGPIYPGTCRSGMPKGSAARSTRLRVGNNRIRFVDRLQGVIDENLADVVGDFVLQRSDGLFAYQLAVVVDDAKQGVTDIVRGVDLLDCTSRQIYLQQVLGLATPRYLHLPIAVNRNGEKLSKQTHAPALDPSRPVPLLLKAMRCLGQEPPATIDEHDLDAFWDWAIPAWRADRIPPTRIVGEH